MAGDMASASWSGPRLHEKNQMDFRQTFHKTAARNLSCIFRKDEVK